jgi:acetate kinase
MKRGPAARGGRGGGEVSEGAILVVNAGSTSLKLHLVDERGASEAVDEIETVDPRRVRGVAHRVVHGGPELRDPVVIEAAVRERIFELEALAPLHNGPALRAIARAEGALPGVRQVAVFDTGFHRTMPAEAAVYPLPARWREEWGIRRYGFHGLSVAWSARRAPELLGRAAPGLRLVVCHLGGGCSVSAVLDGCSVDTTMGFSPLEGVPMATRSGSVDPGALTYLTREHGIEAEELERALNLESGLRALAGGSGDMRELVGAAEEGDGGAELALEVFAHRLAAAVAAMAAAAGGLDAIVFTGGIGENSPPVRERVCERLRFLAVESDPVLNRAAVPDCEIDTAGSGVRLLVLRAREELVAAAAARELL